MNAPCAILRARGPRGIAFAALAGALVTAGCDSGGDTPAASLSPTATVAATAAGMSPVAATGTTATAATVPTLAATASSIPQTAPPAAATPTNTVAPTSTPPSPGAPPRSFGVGEWAYDYGLVGNTCGVDAARTYLPVTQVLEEVSPSDGYIADGEQVRVYSFNGGPSLGTITFRWPTLSYQVSLNEPGGIRTEVTHTYFDARSGSSKVVEVYARGAGTCELTYAG